MPRIERLNDRLQPLFALQHRQVVLSSRIPLRPNLVVAAIHVDGLHRTPTMHARVEATRVGRRDARRRRVERATVENEAEVALGVVDEVAGNFVDGTAVLGGGERAGRVNEERFEEVADVVRSLLCEGVLLLLIGKLDCKRKSELSV